MSVVGIVPAAGHGTRLKMRVGSKEAYPINGRPVIDYLVERMRLAPCDEIRIVTRKEKGDVVAYAACQGAAIIKASPPTLGKSIALGLRGLAGDDVVLIGFPDSIWEPVDGYSTLLARLDEGYEVALGLFRARNPETCDVVLLGDSGLVSDLELKAPAPTSDVFWGAAAARAHALQDLSHWDDPGRLFKSLCRETPIPGVWLSDCYVDIGTEAGLREAIALRQVPPR